MPPTEVPLADEDIIVQGRVIRPRGHDPESYQKVWAAVRAWQMIDGMIARAFPDRANRAAILGNALPFIRDTDSDIMAAVWTQIATALRYGPADGETSIPRPRPRIA
jgi:hypothetical protein